jgi:adenylosuccinate lyase
MAHTIIAFNSIEKGLGKLLLNQDAIKKDLDDNWAVVAEAIQTILRRENYDHPYEALRQLTRGKQAINQSDIHDFIDTLDVKPEVKSEMKKITPSNYTGVDLMDGEL